MIAPLDGILLTLMIVCAIAALEGVDLLASLILFGVFSFLAAAFYAVIGAPDVAFTEAALGAVIATVFYISAIHGSTPKVKPRRLLTPAGLLSWPAVLTVGFIMGLAAWSLPLLGDPSSPASRLISPRFIESGLKETGARNMVTSVIVDYRGYDTLGETIVILTAGLACLLIIPSAWPKGNPSR